jgi:hypothetical protein
VERALDPDRLRLALGDHDALPSPQELSDAIADAEVRALLGPVALSDQTLSVAWYLLSVASVKPALQIYGADRQRAAFEVAGHIFDLGLRQEGLSDRDRSEYAFAAEVAYLRGSLDPNASAVYRTSIAGRMLDIRLPDDLELIAPRIGSALLALDADYIFRAGRTLREQVQEVSAVFEAPDCVGTIFAAAAGVVLGVWDLLVFLLYGEEARRDRAIRRFEAAVVDEGSEGDRTSRWVAAHLLAIAGGLGETSIWTALPPEVPPGIRRAFALSSPRVVSLWPPQLEILGSDPESNPLSSQAKRALLSMPTSAGKTLLAQLLVATHLGTETSGVCYVAPTRSLCAEVASTLDRRLHFIDFTAAGDFPEFADLADLAELPPDVEVMTPERLAYLLRQSASEVLERFGLFIIDEAHTVSDPSRGWTLESSLAYLHERTLDTNHRIILMSAALGNSEHFIQWLQGQDRPVAAHSSAWRGPRRMHCLWQTDPLWQQETVQESRSEAYPMRRRYPVIGRLTARPTRDGHLRELTTQGSIGELVLRVPASGERPRRDTNLSTPHYRMLVPLIAFLSDSGPVLVIEGTRRDTVQMARAIAGSIDRIDSAALVALQESVATRLGPGHPLNEVVLHGVAFHHGALPLDVRSQIEDAMRTGELKILVATTSLTEGVNLPVRSVVVASQGAYGAEGYTEFITGPRLINAIGRAGRATQETQAVVVLAPPGAVSVGDLDQLDPPPEQLHAISSIATAEALASLAAFEDRIRESQDAVFERQSRLIGDFLAFVWLLASELEDAAESVTTAEIEAVLSRTLAWQQLSEEVLARYRSAAGTALDGFFRVPSDRRRRWARAGTSIPSATVLQDIAADVANLDASIQEDRVSLIGHVLTSDRLEQLLQITEAPSIRLSIVEEVLVE